MQEYDSRILQQAVDDLYNEADGIVIVYTFLGVCLGAIAGFLVETLATKERGVGFGALLGAVFFGVAGYNLGKRRSWDLRFRAQQLRLQMQIEENTRRTAEAICSKTSGTSGTLGTC